MLPYFAHVNSAKCCANENGATHAARARMEQAPEEFFEMCREFARTELPILVPEVVITQGAKARLIMPQDEVAAPI